jgi:hypothetical protein
MFFISAKAREIITMHFKNEKIDEKILLGVVYVEIRQGRKVAVLA